MFRQKQNCRSDSILISVDKKVYIVYRKAFGNTGSLFMYRETWFPLQKNVQWGCTIFDSHTEMIYGIIKTAERSEYKAYSMKNYLCMSIITKKSSKNADLRENYGYFPSKIFIYTQKVKMNRD